MTQNLRLWHFPCVQNISDSLTISNAKSVPFWHKWTIKAPGITIHNPIATLTSVTRTSINLVTTQIYNFGISSVLMLHLCPNGKLLCYLRFTYGYGAIIFICTKMHWTAFSPYLCISMGFYVKYLCLHFSLVLKIRGFVKFVAI